MFCVYEERVACYSCSQEKEFLCLSLPLLPSLNDVKEGQKRISALVIQQYDLENMGKQLGSFCFVCFFFEKQNKQNTVLLPKMGRQSINSGSREESLLHSLFYFLLTI